MPRMTKRERIESTLAGKPVDRVPVAFWRHWPGDDQRPESLAEVALDFQKRYDLDFIKLPVASTYTVADYGVKYSYQGNLIGDHNYDDYAVKTLDDWDRIKPLDIHEGVYGWHLTALKNIIKQKEKDTPVIVTMFNPLSILAYLAGDAVFLGHQRSHPERVGPALEAVTETSVRFARAALEEGADGIFFSTRFASYEMMPEREYLRFARASDLAVLEAAANGWFNVLHLHGQFPILERLTDYPVKAVNWHDRTTPYNLSEAGKIFQGALMGGIEQYKLLRFGNPQEVEAQAKEAIRQMQGRRLILSPGCTYPLDVPHANLLALRRAVEA